MPPRTPRNSKVHLAFGAFFWRAFLLIFLFLEVVLYLQLGRMGVPKQQQFGAMLFFSITMAGWAFFSGTVATLVAEFVVRLVIRPVVAAWQKPPIDPTVVPFHLEVREAAIDSVPVRMKSGRQWTPGTLVRTDRRICFFPKAWDIEPWSLSLDLVDRVHTIDAPRMFLGFVKGIPPLLAIRPRDGTDHLFAVAEPLKVRDAFCPTDSALVSWIA